MKARETPAIGVFALALAMLFACTPASSPEDAPNGLKIAFIGDQGASGGQGKAPEVLQLIKDEGADVVVHQGDFGYEIEPEAWEALINDVLGEEFPYFGSAGNHDVGKWDGYQEVLEDRARRIGVSWDGQLGVKSSLTYKGVFIVLIAPGVFETGHGDYVREQLAKDDSHWRVCSWHKNQGPMQVGGKSSETGWDVYEEARLGGAIIATGHEHSYSRTHLLSDVASRTIVDRSDTLHITRGRTFIFVNGMAGRSMRRLRRLPLEDWWARAYTTDNGSSYGALFGTFGVGGRPDVAEFYFKDIDGRVIDRFRAISHVRRKAPPPPTGDRGLIAAAASGDLETVERLLAEGAEVDGRSRSGRTALMVALSRGRLSEARALIGAGADVEAVDNAGMTTLMHAASGRDGGMIRELARLGADVDARTSTGASALLLAAAQEQGSDVVPTLIELGAKTEIADSTGRTPLMIAAAEGNRSDAIALAAKSNVNARDHAERTALMAAVYKADPGGAVEAMIRAGADVNAADRDGRTVLMCAADAGSADSVRRLVAAGARVDASDDLGRTALMWAAQGRLVPSDLEHIAIIETLLNAGADRGALDDEGRTSATWARYNGNAKVAALLK